MIDSFEDQPSDLQELSFNMINRFVQEKLEGGSRVIWPQQTPGTYDNYACFMSDQCPWHIVLEVKEGQRSFVGPLPVQLECCYAFIRDLCPYLNRIASAGLFRRFPTPAILESLVNAVIHFDAGAGMVIRVTVSEDMMEVVSPGGMEPPDGSDEDRGSPRNRRLAEFLHRLKYASLSGNGLVKIRRCYSNTGLVPAIIAEDDRFCIRLPSVDHPLKHPDCMERVVCYLREHPGATMEMMSIDLMMSIFTLKKVMSILEDDGRAFELGRGAYRKVFLTDPRETIPAEVISDARDGFPLDCKEQIPTTRFSSHDGRRPGYHPLSNAGR